MQQTGVPEPSPAWEKTTLRRVPNLTEIQRISRRLAAAEVRAGKIRAERDAAIVAAHGDGESPKLIAVAFAGTSGVTYSAWVQPLATGSVGPLVQRTQVPDVSR